MQIWNFADVIDFVGGPANGLSKLRDSVSRSTATIAVMQHGLADMAWRLRFAIVGALALSCIAGRELYRRNAGR